MRYNNNSVSLFLFALINIKYVTSVFFFSRIFLFFLASFVFAISLFLEILLYFYVYFYLSASLILRCFISMLD